MDLSLLLLPVVPNSVHSCSEGRTGAAATVCISVLFEASVGVERGDGATGGKFWEWRQRNSR